jgi:exosortase
MNKPATAAAASAPRSITDPDQILPFSVLIGLSVLLLIGFGKTMIDLSDYWSDPQYSHGYLVPLFSLVWFYLRWEPIGEVPTWERWSGAALLAFGLGIWLFASYLGIPYIEMVAFLPCIIGVFLLVGGVKIMRWAGPGLGMMIFMYPLPGFMNRALLVPLNRFATIASTFCVQTLGIASYRTGNTIKLLGQDLNVVDACSGLRMATIFLAMAVGVALLIERPMWMRILVVCSALPIAIVTNMIRIVVTAILYSFKLGDSAQAVFHDLAGYIMPIIALGFLFLFLQILDNLFITVETAKPKIGAVGLKPAMKLKGSGA